MSWIVFDELDPFLSIDTMAIMILEAIREDEVMTRCKSSKLKVVRGPRDGLQPLILCADDFCTQLSISTVFTREIHLWSNR
jgi:hypothetical protein